MKFTINSIILWPRNAEHSPRCLSFNSEAVNIITGASRTGKSALIPIIDYCLGSDKCTIPVDIIRDACSWFGVLFDMANEQMLLCRREPGNKGSTDDMFLLRDKSVAIPEQIEKNTNVTSIKNLLNELFGMSFLELDPDAGVFRPSYRDFMAFLFQPQNIVANADVLFYKADTMEHRKKLIDVFPYALGAVTPETLAKRKEIERLSKISERYRRDLEQIKVVAEGWKHEVAGWLTQAHEYGLTDYVTNDNDEFARQVDELRVISQKRIADASVASAHVAYLSEDIVALRQEEQQTSSELFAVRRRHTEMLQLMQSMGQYDKSLQIQLDRLDGVDETSVAHAAVLRGDGAGLGADESLLLQTGHILPHSVFAQPHRPTDGAVAGMTLVGPAVLAAEKVIVDGDLVRSETEIEDFVWDEIVVLVRIPLRPALEHQASPPVCASTHRRNFSLGTTMRFPIRRAGKPVSCMS